MTTSDLNKQTFLKRKRNHDYKCGKDAVIKEVASLIGVGPIEYEGASDSLRENLRTYHSDNENLKELISSVRVSSPTSIKIELNSVDIEKARRVIEFLKNF